MSKQTAADTARFNDNMNIAAQLNGRLLDPSTPESAVPEIKAEINRRIKAAQPWRTDL
jgi:hypothetical protein